MKLQDMKQQKNEPKKNGTKWKKNIIKNDKRTKNETKLSPFAKNFSRGFAPRRRRRRVKTVQEGVAQWAEQAIELIKIIINQMTRPLYHRLIII